MEAMALLEIRQGTTSPKMHCAGNTLPNVLWALERAVVLHTHSVSDGKCECQRQYEGNSATFISMQFIREV